MKLITAIFMVALVFAHQDFWWWDQYEPLILGFLPIGLAWHMSISLLTSAVGYLAIRYFWTSTHELYPEKDPGNPDQ